MFDACLTDNVMASLNVYVSHYSWGFRLFASIDLSLFNEFKALNAVNRLDSPFTFIYDIIFQELKTILTGGIFILVSIRAVLNQDQQHQVFCTTSNEQCSTN